MATRPKVQIYEDLCVWINSYYGLTIAPDALYMAVINSRIVKDAT